MVAASDIAPRGGDASIGPCHTQMSDFVDAFVKHDPTASSIVVESDEGCPDAGVSCLDDSTLSNPTFAADDESNRENLHEENVPSVREAVSETQKYAGLHWRMPDPAAAVGKSRNSLDAFASAVGNKATFLKHMAYNTLVTETPVVVEPEHEEEEDTKRIAGKLKSSWLVLLGRSGGMHSKDTPVGKYTPQQITVEQTSDDEVVGSEAAPPDDTAADVVPAEGADIKEQVDTGVTPADSEDASESPGDDTTCQSVKEFAEEDGVAQDAAQSQASSKRGLDDFLSRARRVIEVEAPQVKESAREFANGVRLRIELTEADIKRMSDRLKSGWLVLLSQGGMGDRSPTVPLEGHGEHEVADGVSFVSASDAMLWRGVAGLNAELERPRRALESLAAVAGTKANLLKSRVNSVKVPALSIPLLEEEMRDGASRLGGDMKGFLKQHIGSVLGRNGTPGSPSHSREDTGRETESETAEVADDDQSTSEVAKKSTLAQMGSDSVKTAWNGLAAKAEKPKAAAHEMWRGVCKTKQTAVKDLRHGVDDLRHRGKQFKRALWEIIPNPSTARTSPHSVAVDPARLTVDESEPSSGDGSLEQAQADSSSVGCAQLIPTEREIPESAIPSTSTGSSNTSADAVDDIVN